MVCGNIENIEFSVLSHGNSKDKKPFMRLRKVPFPNVKVNFLAVVGSVR